MTILCYHSVEPDWDSPMAMTPGEFEAHLRWLARERTVRDLPEVVSAFDGDRGASEVTALTFDDGFTGIQEHALPVLQRYGLAATVFLVAETLTPAGRAADWLRGNGYAPRALDRKQVLEMRDEGVRFGSHSFSHRILTTLSARECLEDLRRSREVLEDLLQQAVPYLAYPGGRHDAHVRRAAEAAGFSHAFTLPERREPSGRFAIPRVGLYRGNGTLALRVKVSRWYLPLRTSGLYTSMRAGLSRKVAPPT
jgi:peptidoglycan/xylan/chitin deacetylase (PgdA/CDA1 family)